MLAIYSSPSWLYNPLVSFSPRTEGGMSAERISDCCKCSKIFMRTSLSMLLSAINEKPSPIWSPVGSSDSQASRKLAPRLKLTVILCSL